ncbi:MAG: PilN domain-containing protein, partial [Candidatus Omnitrophica bacterium]|nr:PilN domain-containing protein [Candidatus Omnitrophota bacterium]
CSLFRAVNTSIRIDLLAVKKLMDRPKETTFAGEVAALVTETKLDPRAITLAILIIGGTFGYCYYRETPLKKELEKSIIHRPEVVTVSAGSNYADLVSVGTRYKEKLAILDKFVRKQLYFTELLNTLPALMPEGVWFLELNFRQENNNPELDLECIAFSTGNEKGLKLANDFFMTLKQNQNFSKFFKKANVTSMKQSEDKGLVITRFAISCRRA